MYHHLCPRCGLAFPEWQPVHLICLLLRLRYILAPFFIISVLMSVSLWLHLRSTFKANDNNHTEQTQISSIEKSIPPISTRQNDNASSSANSLAMMQVPVIEPTPVISSSSVTQPSPPSPPSPPLTNITLMNLLPKPIPAQSDLSETVYYVNTQQLNVRSGPGPEYDILTKLSRGESIIAFTRTESQDKGFWMKIRTGSLEGWVNEKLVSRDKSETINKQPSTPMFDETVYYVSTKNLNVRSGPGQEYSVITKLSQGSPVHSFEKKESKDGGSWVRIRTSSSEGWVNKKLLSGNK